MDDILNDNMRECYSISGYVVVKYYELYEIMMNNSIEDSSIYETYVNDILELVIKEYEMYRKLSLDDVNMCLNLIKNVDCDSLMIDARFKHKLEMLKKIYEGHKIDFDELKLYCIVKNIEVPLLEVLYSLIDIEVMKKLRKKIDVITSNNYSDLLFIKTLNKRFNLVLFNQTYSNNLTEMVNLSYNMDVLNVPTIDINILIEKINNMFQISNDSCFNPVDMTLIEIARITIDRLVEVNFENNPKIVFDNLLFITRLEVLISYMNIDCLLSLLDYCESVKSRNNFGIDKVIKIISKKINQGDCVWIMN